MLQNKISSAKCKLIFNVDRNFSFLSLNIICTISKLYAIKKQSLTADKYKISMMLRNKSKMSGLTSDQ